MAPEKPLWELTSEEWGTVVRANLKGHICPVRAAIPVKMKQGSGRLIYVSSASAISATSGAVGNNQASVYGASKSGLLGLMWGTALELYPQGITLIAILPGAASRLIDIRLPDTEQAAAFRSDKALGTWRHPVHITPPVAYLLSDRGANINGQIFAMIGRRLALYNSVQPQKVINANEGAGFSMDELFRRFPNEFGDELVFDPAVFPPPVSD